MAHKVGIKCSALDPTGTDIVRSLEDMRRIHKCPVAALLNGGANSECAARTNRDIESLNLHIIDDEIEQFRVNNEKEFREDMLEAMLLYNPKNADGQGVAEMDKLLASKLKDADDRKAIGRFAFLLEVFEKLFTNPWIKRGHVYKQLEAVGKKDDCEYATKSWIKALYVLRPMMIFTISFGFQSFMLHLATHYYIFYMDNEEGHNKRQENGGQLLDVFGNLVGKYVSVGDVSGQGAVYEGKANFPLVILDATAAIPLGFCMLAYSLSLVKFKTFNIALWNKTFIVASLMAIIKGIFDVVTILPDSTGWENCMERLGDTGLKSLRQLDFASDFLGSFFNQLRSELLGGGGKHGARVRYCADMMVSGHTYFACLFSMSAYKQIAYNSEVIPTTLNIMIRHAVFIICILCICTEVVLVAAARFHYTVDMLSAMVLVFLLFDSRHIEQLAANWSEGYAWRDPNFVPHWGLRHLLGYKPTNGALIPSQGTSFNHRLMAGKNIWVEPDDDMHPYHGAHRCSVVGASPQTDSRPETQRLLTPCP